MRKNKLEIQWKDRWKWKQFAKRWSDSCHKHKLEFKTLNNNTVGNGRLKIFWEQNMINC